MTDEQRCTTIGCDRAANHIAPCWVSAADERRALDFETDGRTARTWDLVSALRDVNRTIRSIETHGDETDRGTLETMRTQRAEIKRAIETLNPKQKRS